MGIRRHASPMPPRATEAVQRPGPRLWEAGQRAFARRRDRYRSIAARCSRYVRE